MSKLLQQQESLNIQSGQGYEFELPIAGLGSRAYAFTIDWHIRFLIALVWILLTLLISKQFTEASFAGIVFSFLPAAIIYFLYHPIVELFMDGNTPGKRYAKVRVVTTEGDIPSSSAILVRNVLRIVDTLPMFYLVGMGACLITKEQRRIGDIAAGTLLVYEDTKDSLLNNLSEYVKNDKYSVKQLQTVQNLLDRWPDLE